MLCDFGQAAIVKVKSSNLREACLQAVPLNGPDGSALLCPFLGHLQKHFGTGAGGVGLPRYFEKAGKDMYRAPEMNLPVQACWRTACAH